MGTEPVAGGNTPSISRRKPWEPELGHRGDQVVPDRLLVLKELCGHHRTDGVAPPILGCRSTRTVPEPPGHWIAAAGLKFTAEHIEISHGADTRRSTERVRAATR
jgi:hypothetical protein